MMLVKRLQNIGFRSRKLILGTGSILLSMVLNNISRIITISILTRYFSKEEFGLWTAITSILAISITCDFGISNSLRNKLSYFHSIGEDEKARSYFFATFYLFLFIGLLISFILIFFNEHIPISLFFNTNNIILLNSGKIIIIVSLILIFLGIPFGLGTVLFFSYQEAHWFSMTNIFQSICYLIIVVVLIALNSSIVTISISYFLVSLIAGIFGTVIFLKKRRWKPCFIKIIEILKYNSDIAPLGFKFFGIQIAHSVLSNSMTIVCASQVDLESTGQFSLVQKIYFLFLNLYLSVSNPLWSAYSDAINLKDWVWCKKTFIRFFWVSLSIFIFLMLFITIFGDFLLKLLAGAKYNAPAVLYTIVGVWTIFNVIGNCCSQLLNASGRIDIILLTNFALAVASFPFLSYFAGRYGIIGIALGGIIISAMGAAVTVFESVKFIYRMEKHKL